MAMPPQFAKTPGKGMPPSKPGDKPNPFAKKGGSAAAKGKKPTGAKQPGNPFAKKGGSAAAKAPAKGKAGVNPFAKK